MQPTTAPVASPIKPHDSRRQRRRTYIRVDAEVNVSLDDIDTDDLIAELESRSVTGVALQPDECARIATLHLCGQRAQAEREALALVLETHQLGGGGGQ